MKKYLLLQTFLLLFLIQLKADRIFIMNSSGFNSATPALITAITNNGHTVVQNVAGVYTLPVGFTTRCVDSVNGYDWLCFFGTQSFASLLPQIQAYIDLGGKVFYQYEVGCCTVASNDAAIIASGLTGLSITPNANSAIASSLQGWEATNVNCCATIMGGAYKGMDGLPLANQLLATANLGGSTPSITLSQNFGFVFATNDFLGTANKGGIIGLGDFNPWFNGMAPTNPIFLPLVNFIFPNDTSTCYIFPPGCLQSFSGLGSSALAFTLGNDTTICPGQSFTLDASVIGATYLWQDGSTNATFNVNQSGTYWVTVTIPCGTATDTIHVTSGTTPLLNLGNDTTICQGQSINLNAGNAGATYLWQNGSTNQTFIANQSGTYWVQVTTNCGSITDTIHLTVVPAPIVNLGNDTTLCQGPSITLNAGNPGATYLWQNGATSTSIQVNQSGTYWVKVTAGCSASDTIQITFSPLPPLNLGSDQTLCYGESLILDVSYPGATYLWQNASNNPTYTVVSSGLYWVELDLNNCKIRDSIFVTINPYFTVDLGPDQTHCEGTSVLLDASGTGLSYLWQDNSNNATYTATQSGIYWVEVSIGNCKKQDSVNLTFNSYPMIELGPDKSLCPEQTILLDATTPNAIYLWNTQSENPKILVSEEGTYIVQVTVKNCSSTDSIHIDFLQEGCLCSVYLPNAFSPNNDLINDELRLINSHDIMVKEFKIYDRWGNEVFKTQTVDNSWNGMYKGAPAETGTYFYYLKYTCRYNLKEYFLKGDITLVR